MRPLGVTSTEVRGNVTTEMKFPRDARLPRFLVNALSDLQATLEAEESISIVYVIFGFRTLGLR